MTTVPVTTCRVTIAPATSACPSASEATARQAGGAPWRQVSGTRDGAHRCPRPDLLVGGELALDRREPVVDVRDPAAE